MDWFLMQYLYNKYVLILCECVKKLLLNFDGLWGPPPMQHMPNQIDPSFGLFSYTPKT